MRLMRSSLCYNGGLMGSLMCRRLGFNLGLQANLMSLMRRSLGFDLGLQASLMSLMRCSLGFDRGL